jgi:hypothetical protein
MNDLDVVHKRLINQRLTGTKFDKPEDVVNWFGAVQSQDYAAAKWALGLRLKNAVDQDIENAFNRGDILRTHIMRPTWHFVMPQDIRWMLELTAPRVKFLLAHYDRKLETTAKIILRTNRLITQALKGDKHLTREELGDHLKRNKIVARGQKLGHIVMHAEQDGIICSGPKSGKQFTYALLEERVLKTKKLTRDQALSKLALKYFTSHGPAQLKDFAWWSGLSVKDASAGLDSIKSKLVSEAADQKTYWSVLSKKTTPKFCAFLLSIFDEYTIAYKDRSDLSQANDIERTISMGNALTSVIIINGKVAGTWKRTLSKNSVKVKLSPFRKLHKIEHVALQDAVIKYGKFIAMPTTIL